MVDTSPADPQGKDRRRGRLFRRYFLFIMALVCGALLASGAISLYASYQENKAALARLQKEKAIAAAARIEQFIKGIEQQLSFASLPQLGSEGAAQRRIEFLKLLRQAPAVTDIAQLDAQGREILTVSRLSMDSADANRDRANDPAFLNAKPGKPWIGPVYFRKETEPYFTVGLKTGGGGVTVAEVNLKFVWDVVSRIRVGENGKAYVVDAKGQLVADPDIGLVLRKTDLSGLAQVKAALGGALEDEPALLARSQDGGEVLTAWSPIETLGWEVFVEQPVSEVYATLNAAILRTGLLLLAGLVVSAIVSTLLARRMVQPIRELQESAQRIGAGDLEQRIEVHTNDELESLGEQFNRMTAQLRESYAGLERKVEERTGELSEALEYQTAISEVLRVISESPTDVTPVFRTILDCTRRLFDNPMTAVLIYDGAKVDLVATGNWPEDALEDSKRFYPAPPNPKMMSGRVILAGKVLSIEDTLSDEGYDQTTAATGHWRRMLGAPMVKEGATVGALIVAWPDPGVTPQRQADLLKTFADQAVIAIENVRLINETKIALDRQTTTAEILRVISQSMDDPKPVFQAIAERTSKLFGGEQIGLLLVEGDQLILAGSAGNEAWNLKDRNDLVRKFFPKPLTRETSSGVAILEQRVVEISDIEDPEIVAAMPNLIPLMRQCGYRSELCVPMMRGDEAVGTISVNRSTTGNFTPSEVQLLKTFADQAVIAIENARLFNETRNALERQTATAEILRVISSSPTDTKPVFEAIAAASARLIGEDSRASVWISRDGHYQPVAFSHRDDAADRVAMHYPRPIMNDSLIGHVLSMAKATQVEDVFVTGFEQAKRVAQERGWRAWLGAPLMWEGVAIGAIGVARGRAGTFPGSQESLLKTFADQAVIAIQNVRLFNEIEEKSRQLELANQHKSDFLANMSHELRTPLNAVIGFSEVLAEGMFGELNEKQQEYVGDIHASGKHLLSLINDILDLSKIEAGRMELEAGTFHLPSAIGNAITLVRERAQRHGIELREEVDETLGDYSGDERKFKQIMLNLLSNAVKFTGDGGRVTVAARRDGEAIEVSVADTGIGIAPEDQPKVFEEFVQVGSDYATKREGTGLGLPLARRFVELHGGRMWLTSEPGRGSTFFFSLPIRAEAHA